MNIDVAKADVSEQKFINSLSISMDDRELNKPVIIKDPAFELRIRTKLKLKDGESITKKKLLTITYFSYEAEDLKSIEGIQYMKNISYVNLKTGQIDGLARLSELPKLRELNVKIDGISFDFLKNCKALDTLRITTDKLTKIPNFEKLENLRELEVKNAGLSDISGLKDLNNIQILKLDGNDVKDINPLANMKKLWLLSLRDNSIEDISPLSDVSNLKILDIMNSGVKDISALKNLSTFQAINLAKTDVSDLSPLSNHKLSDINISNMKELKDISALSKISTLKTFSSINNPQVNFDISFGGDEKMHLEFVDLDRCGLENLKFLKDVEVENLDISNNNIKKLDILPAPEELIRLNASNNNIESMNEIKKFPKLIFLSLNSNPLSKWTYQSMPELQELSLKSTRIYSLKNFKNYFPKLIYLNLDDTHLKSLKPLRNLLYMKETSLEGTTVEE
jgi:Leucine-rich repeat (LRR) protein